MKYNNTDLKSWFDEIAQKASEFDRLQVALNGFAFALYGEGSMGMYIIDFQDGAWHVKANGVLKAFVDPKDALTYLLADAIESHAGVQDGD